jgi:cell wall assembly regulator SMI1
MADDDVARTWLRLETWARSNLPGTLAELNGPADPQAIARLEGTLGFALPIDFRTSLGVHDGETGDGALLDSGGQLLNVRAIEDDLELERRALRDNPELAADKLSGPARRSLYASRRVPIIDLNRDPMWLLDLDPAPGGQMGQVLMRDVEDGRLEVVAPSFAQFLSDYLHRLETGRARFAKEQLDRLKQTPSDRSAFNARLQRFSEALKAQRAFDIRRLPDGSDVEIVGSLAARTPDIRPGEHALMTGTSRLILIDKDGVSRKGFGTGAEPHLYRVRGVVRRRLSRHGREEITLELEGFEPFV